MRSAAAILCLFVASISISTADVVVGVGVFDPATTNPGISAVPGPDPGAAAAKVKDREATRKKMQELAPVDVGGDPVAHLWLARDLARRESQTPEEQELLRRHLEHLVRQKPNAPVAQLMLSNFHLRAGRPDESLPHLQQVADVAPRYRLQLAALLRRLKREDEATAQLQQASEHFRKLAEADAENIGARILWAHAELQLKHYDAVAKIIKEGMAHKEDLRYHGLAADMYLAQARDALSLEEPDLRQAFLRLQLALKAAPRYSRVLIAIHAFSQQHPDSRGTIRKWLEDVVATEKASFLARQILGDMATQDGNYLAAMVQYERALGMNPKASALSNNLAHCLGQLGPTHLQRALVMSKRAIQLGSSNPQTVAEYHVTRGMLFIKAEQWQDAVSELQTAEKVFPDRADVKEGLSAAMSALGQSKAGNR